MLFNFKKNAEVEGKLLSPPSLRTPIDIMTLPSCKCVVVGDGAVGKTCMLSVYARKGFPKKYIPTIFDNYSATVEVEGSPIQLHLWDTAGQEEFDKLRFLSYPDTDVFIICFSVDNLITFSNVREKWIQDVKDHLRPTGRASVILAGTKCDLRQDLTRDRSTFVTEAQATALAKDINASAYVECSAMQDGYNVKTVFDEAIRARFSLVSELVVKTDARKTATVQAEPLSPAPDPRSEPPKPSGTATTQKQTTVVASPPPPPPPSIAKAAQNAPRLVKPVKQKGCC